MSPVAFLLLAYIMLPVYMRAGISTMPQFILARFGPGVRSYMTFITLTFVFVTRVSASLLAGVIVFDSLLKWNQWLSVLLLLFMTAAVVIATGLKGVIRMEVLNTTVLLAGGFVNTWIALTVVGGWNGLITRVQHGAEYVDTGVTEDFLHIRQSEGVYAVVGLLLGAPWLVAQFHTTEQEMVQRALAASSVRTGALGSVVAGLFKLSIPFAWCIPGIVARMTFPKEFGCGPVGPCKQANDAFPILLERLIPTGLRGLMVAAMIGAIMSVLASSFNSASTVFANDVYATWVRHRGGTPNSTHKVRAGKLYVVLLLIVAVLWMPVLASLSASFYVSLQTLAAVVAPPIVVVFFGGVLWPRGTSKGAIAALIIGHGAGFLRLITVLAAGTGTDNKHVPGSSSESGWVRTFARSNFLNYAAVQGALALGAFITVSLLSAAPSPLVARKTCFVPALKLYARFQANPDWARAAERAAADQAALHDQDFREGVHVYTSVSQGAAMTDAMGGYTDDDRARPRFSPRLADTDSEAEDQEDQEDGTAYDTRPIAAPGAGGLEDEEFGETQVEAKPIDASMAAAPAAAPYGSMDLAGGGSDGRLEHIEANVRQALKREDAIFHAISVFVAAATIGTVWYFWYPPADTFK